jgi:hypothetical protein
MGIKLSFEITSPLGPDDKDLLTGISIMTLAIANHELAKEHFPDVFPDGEDVREEAREPMQEQALPCASADGRGKYCVNEVGHRGRHRFRQILPPHPGIN